MKVDHKTVGSVRAEQEARGEIPHVEKRKDAKGRKQPAKRKAATTAETAIETVHKPVHDCRGLPTDTGLTAQARCAKDWRQTFAEAVRHLMGCASRPSVLFACVVPPADVAMVANFLSQVAAVRPGAEDDAAASAEKMKAAHAARDVATASCGSQHQIPADLSIPEFMCRTGSELTMSERLRLPNRRASEQIAFVSNDLKYIATVSFFLDGRLTEIFISNAKAGSHSDSAAKDSAVVCSIALQYGVPLDVIRHALLRDAHGVASLPLGVALDLIGIPRHDQAHPSARSISSTAHATAAARQHMGAHRTAAAALPVRRHYGDDRYRKGPHAASLICATCGVHCGWLSHVTHKFLTETINRFGRPTEPIVIRGGGEEAD